MIYGIAIDAFYGIRQKRAYECDHEGDGFFPIADNATAAYVKGYSKPNYPMPAIRYEVDYMYRWPTNEAVACVLWYMSNPELPVCLEYWH